jgi:hypothetical protein
MSTIPVVMSVSIGPGWMLLMVIQRQFAHQCGHRGLAHRVHAAADHTAAHGGVAADGDDATAVHHLCRSGLDGQEHATDVDRQHLVQHLQRKPIQRTAAVDAGIDHRDLQRAEAGGGIGHRRGDRMRVGAVGLYRDGLATGGPDVGDHLGRLVGARGIGQRHRMALACQPAGDRGADTAGSAEYQRGPVRSRKVLAHVRVLVGSRRRPRRRWGHCTPRAYRRRVPASPHLSAKPGKTGGRYIRIQSGRRPTPGGYSAAVQWRTPTRGVFPCCVRYRFP